MRGRYHARKKASKKSHWIETAVQTVCHIFLLLETRSFSEVALGKINTKIQFSQFLFCFLSLYISIKMTQFTKPFPANLNA